MSWLPVAFIASIGGEDGFQKPFVVGCICSGIASSILHAIQAKFVPLTIRLGTLKTAFSTLAKSAVTRYV